VVDDDDDDDDVVVVVVGVVVTDVVRFGESWALTVRVVVLR
jgi:hypothetical protein